MKLPFSKPPVELHEELEEVASAAGELLDVLTQRRNAPLPPDFPEEQLADICRALTRLPQGTAEGCRSPLEYARNRLPSIRREHVQISKGQHQDSHQLVSRGTSIDIKIVQLISSVTTALDEYRRISAEEPESEDAPEVSQPVSSNVVDDVHRQSDALDESLKSAESTVDAVTAPDSDRADSLKRQLKDVAGINTLGSAEIRMPRVVSGWLRKVSTALNSYPEVIRRTTEKLRIGVDVVQVGYDRWHEFQHEGVHFLFDQIRKTADSADKVSVILDANKSASYKGARVAPKLTQAALEVLEAVRSPLSAKQIFERLELNGYVAKTEADWPSEKSYKRIYAALGRRDRTIGDVINIGNGFWVLVKYVPKGDVTKIREAREKSPERREHSKKTRAGMTAAKTKGGRFGPVPKLSEEDIAEAQRMRDEGAVVPIIARKFGVSTKSIYEKTINRRRIRRSS